MYNLFLLATYLVFSVKVYAEPSAQNSSRDSLGLVSFLSSALGVFPGKTACVSNEYRKILQLDQYRSDDAVGGSNAGFVRLMDQQYQGSKCFRVALQKFYQEIDKADAATPGRSRFLTSLGVPQFSSSLQDLGNPQYSPGWLFKTAMKIGGNDPLLALQLVAFCGHDDVQQTQGDAGESVLIECPRADSLMFFNGSMVNIGKRQQPIAGEIALTETRGISPITPSKNYHIIMGSYIGCRLAENCDIDSQAASQYEKKAALGYRMLRLKSEADGLQNKYKNALLKQREDISKKRIPSSKKPSDSLKDHMFEEIKQAQTRNGNTATSSGKPPRVLSDQEIRQRVNRDFDKLVALDAMGDQFFSSALKLIGEVNFSERENGIVRTYDFLGANSQKLKDSCQLLVPDQCDSIVKTLKSWNADLVWTANQHSIGAKLGADSCKESKQKRSGGVPSVCAIYNNEPDLTRETMVLRHQSGSSGTDKKLKPAGKK